MGQERLTDSLTLARAVSVMEKHIGHRFAALMSMEIGGANGVRPFMAAAHLKRPVVDSDTMGRAYPEAQMTSVAVGGLTPYPLTAVDVRGFESIVHKVPTWKWAERVARKICVEYGSVAATCQPPRTGAEVKQWGIHGTATKAMAIGSAVREAQRRHDDPIAAILSVEPGKLLYKGKVLDVARRATEGFLRGVLRLDGLDAWRGSAMTINFQNEWIVAWRDDEPLAMTPDLICVLNSVSGEAVGSETIRYGQRVTVIALPPPPVFLSPRGLDCMSARAPSATTSTSGACSTHETHWHRRGRHQHRRRPDRGRQGGARREGADQRGRHHRHPRFAQEPRIDRRAEGDGSKRIDGVMIGTTHFINAVVQRRHLTKVAALRLGMPASASLPPFCDWPEDLAELVRGGVWMVEGGHEYDGRPFMPLDEAAVTRAARGDEGGGPEVGRHLVDLLAARSQP